MFYVERQISNFLFLYYISKPHFNRWDWHEQHIKTRHVSTKWKSYLNEEVSLFYLTNSWMVLSAMPKQNKQWIGRDGLLIDYQSIIFVLLFSFLYSCTTASSITLMLKGKRQVHVSDHLWSRRLKAWHAKCSPRHCAITLYKAVEISCHSFWWSCILRIMICEVMILVIPNDFRSCPCVLSGVNFLRTLKTAGCAGEGGL